ILSAAAFQAERRISSITESSVPSKFVFILTESGDCAIRSPGNSKFGRQIARSPDREILITSVTFE
ncbi:MAG: hypothetical protein WAN63_06150, partial [Candidatus Sulfotelmatobacter sp.]